MFSKRKTTTSIKNCSDKIRRFAALLKEADTVIIGAGSGLSTSAGFTYTGKRFEDYFPDFIKKYGFTDMYSGGFYPFEDLCEYWAYWSRYIFVNRYMDCDNGTYKRLLELVKDKDYFVLTTNVDHQFQKAGFDKHRLFYTQGDYGLFQCSLPCHNSAYDNEAAIRQMVIEQNDMKIPQGLIPLCPKCGKPMSMNLRADNTFVQNEGWYCASERYSDFIRGHKGTKVLLWELGVGMNTPSIIKYPFWLMTYDNPDVYYVSMNYGEAFAPDEIRKRSICINADIGETINQI